MDRSARFLFVVAMSVLPGLSVADIFKCEISGKTTYTDKPCPQGVGSTRYTPDEPLGEGRSESGKAAQPPKSSAQYAEDGRRRRQAAERLVAEFEEAGSQRLTKAMRQCMGEYVEVYMAFENPPPSAKAIKASVVKSREKCYRDHLREHDITRKAVPGWNVVQQMVQNDRKAAKADGVAFLEKNKGKPGVHVTASGLQYEIVEQGSGASPGPADTVKVRYVGTHLSGKEISPPDARVDGAAEIPLARVIPGWSEGLQLMSRGSVYRLYIPPVLGFGSRGSGDEIAPDEVLQYEIELVDFYPPAAKPQKAREGQRP